MNLQHVEACSNTPISNMDMSLPQRNQLEANYCSKEWNINVFAIKSLNLYLLIEKEDEMSMYLLQFRYIPGTKCQAGFTAHVHSDSLLIDVWNDNHNCTSVKLSSIATVETKKLKVDDKSQKLIGLTFNSFQSILTFVKQFQKEENDVYVTRDSRTLISSDIQEPYNADLEYIYVKFVCKFGEATHTPKVNKVRNTSSYKLGCQFYIYAHITKDKNLLEITKVNLEHINHEDIEAFIGDVPENRRLSPGTYEMALNAMDLNCSKKLLQNKIMNDKKINIRTKDLSNMHRKHKNLMTNDLQVVERMLKSKGADVHILHKNNEYQGLHFSTADMRSSLKAWPDIVFLDGTYKVFNTNLSLMILLVEDSNGLSEVAGIGLLAHEDYLSMKWFLNTVKNENEEACNNIKCFMTDKDMTERKVLKELFPNSLLQICRFHVLKIFSTQITTKNMNITSDQKDFCLSLLTKIVYSSSEEEYNDYYATLSKEAPPQVVKYFNDNWHINRKEWCTYLMEKNLGNYSNNRLESLNGKAKEEIGLNNYISSFVVRFFKWLSSHNRNNDFKASKNFIKIQLPANNFTEWEKLYSNYLTIKAFEYVQTELKYHNHITFWNENNVENTINPDNIEEKYIMMCKSLVITTTNKSCEYPHWLTLFLPCRHIFLIRKNYGVSLFSEELCAIRWTKNYYRSTQRSFRKLKKETVEEVTETQVSQVVTSGENIDSRVELHKQLKYIINDITHTMSLNCGQNFENKMKILSNISSSFKKGSDIEIVKVVPSLTTIKNKLRGTMVTETNVKSVFQKRKIIKSLTDKICESSNSWLLNNWNSKLQTLKEIDNFWRQSIEVDVLEKPSKVAAAAIENSNSKKINKVGQAIKLDYDCKVSDVNTPVKVNTRGRPKGALLTVIGVPKKKRKLSTFSEKSSYEQATVLLNWLQLPDTLKTSKMASHLHL
ncbi:Protein of unknown function [Cotesia congregata]|uniref:Uncharacterized protein n=1 Tax=Cotesia congregata TaxID=51543 RepID=A0A8J2EK13_COTCN|nr:Protein of unknown function [Cotesia congregata]